MSREITIKNIYNYIDGNGRRALEKAGLIQDHIREQIAYRMIKCDSCVKEGKCKVCGCSVPGRLYTTESCNHGSIFPDLMSEENWIEFKSKNISNE